MPEKKEPTFEDKLTRLQTIVEKVEGSPLPLAETLALFEEGNALIKALQKTLDDAEKKIGSYQVAKEPKP